MKKIFILFTLFLFVVKSFSQNDSTKAPYQKFPFFPPAKLLLPDKTYFTKDKLPKKKPVLLMIFNPTCEHCQHETEELTKNIDKFKNVTIVMATTYPYDSLMSFRERYHLAQYNNIIVGRDENYFLITYYMLHSMPFLAFYDKKLDLISVFDGSMPIDKVAEEVHKKSVVSSQ